MPTRRTTAPPRPWRQGLAICVLALLAAAVTPRADGATAPGFRVVVHGSYAGDAVERRFLARAFLKKAAAWGNGEAIHPVDQAAGAPVRRLFSDAVIERSVAAVRNYWQQLIFSGRGIPPPELDSDQAVIHYVSRRPGAVGYVSASADVAGAKVIEVR